MESHRKGKETFSPDRLRKAGLSEEPYERFPNVFSDSPVRGMRRGYNAPWAIPKLDLTTDGVPIETKSNRRLFQESRLKLAVVSQRTAMTRLHQPCFYKTDERKTGFTDGETMKKTAEISFDAKRTRNATALVKFPRVRRGGIL